MFIDLTPLSPSDQADFSEAHYAVMEECKYSPQSCVVIIIIIFSVPTLTDQSTYGVLVPLCFTANRRLGY